jgi:hypothetical protein
MSRLPQSVDHSRNCSRSCAEVAGSATRGTSGGIVAISFVNRRPLACSSEIRRARRNLSLQQPGLRRGVVGIAIADATGRRQIVEGLPEVPDECDDDCRAERLLVTVLRVQEVNDV